MRQTRSQKRALEKESPAAEGDLKRVKLERGELPTVDGLKNSSEQANKVANILRTGEVKATIKVEVQTGEEPVDMSTSKRWAALYIIKPIRIRALHKKLK